MCYSARVAPQDRSAKHLFKSALPIESLSAIAVVSDAAGLSCGDIHRNRGGNQWRGRETISLRRSRLVSSSARNAGVHSQEQLLLAPTENARTASPAPRAPRARAERPAAAPGVEARAAAVAPQRAQPRPPRPPRPPTVAAHGRADSDRPPSIGMRSLSRCSRTESRHARTSSGASTPGSTRRSGLPPSDRRQRLSCAPASNETSARRLVLTRRDARRRNKPSIRAANGWARKGWPLPILRVL
jgi:hypothetical protein